MFGPDGYAAYFEAHTEGGIFAQADPALRAAAFLQAKRELESAIGRAIPEPDSQPGDAVRLDFACYELAMHLIKCAPSPGSGGAVPNYLAQESGDVDSLKAPPSATRWPMAVWRWLGQPSVVLSRG